MICTKIDAVTETKVVEISPAKINLELSLDEALDLLALLAITNGKPHLNRDTYFDIYFVLCKKLNAADIVSRYDYKLVNNDGTSQEFVVGSESSKGIRIRAKR